MTSPDSVIERSPDGSSSEEDLDKMSFLQHLDELRRRLVYCIIALFAAFTVCWSFAPGIFEIIQEPLIRFLGPGEKLAFTRLTSPFFLYMKVAFFAGIFLAAPLILWQGWLFISPGLYKRERRYAGPFIVFASLFFIGGGYFGYRVVLPIACEFFVEMGSQFRQVLTIDEYFSFAGKLLLGMALVFETPILIFFLTRVGIVTPAFLIQKFKYAVVLIFVIAAIITPTPDMVTQAALAIPMIFLYLFGILISWAFAPAPRT